MDNKEALQLQIERQYGKSYINNIVRESIIDSGNEEVITSYEEAIYSFMCTVGSHWESKNKRILTLFNNNDPKELAISILTQVLQTQGVEEIHASVGAVASRLSGFRDHIDAVRTAAELLAVTGDLGVHTLIEPDKSPTGILSIYCGFELEESIQEHINRTIHLPPMICKPDELKDNFYSAWKGKSTEFVILNTFEYHHLEQSLDCINYSNSIAYSICEEMLDLVELPNKELDTREKVEAHDLMVSVSNCVYKLMLDTGNEFYFPHYNCERGRKYAKGYHVDIQGTEYKKSIVDFKEQFTIEVPEHMRTN